LMNHAETEEDKQWKTPLALLGCQQLSQPLLACSLPVWQR
jgi:hypothetical protein